MNQRVSRKIRYPGVIAQEVLIKEETAVDIRSRCAKDGKNGIRKDSWFSEIFGGFRVGFDVSGSARLDGLCSTGSVSARLSC